MSSDLKAFIALVLMVILLFAILGIKSKSEVWMCRISIEGGRVRFGEPEMYSTRDFRDLADPRYIDLCLRKDLILEE